MAEVLRGVAWESTPLGPPPSWPASLRTAVDICLTSRFPMLVLWGEDHVAIYNEAYAPMLGTKHPAALGSPLRDVWPEVWETIAPMLDQVLTDGTATWSEDQRLVLQRQGFPEECYFTYSFSPIREEDGTVAGVFSAVAETTDRVLVDRRLRTLSRLAARTHEGASIKEAGHAAMAALRALPEDLPFAALYLSSEDGDHATLLTSHGLDDAPSQISLDGSDPAWGVAQAIRSCEAHRLNVDGVRLPPVLDSASTMPEHAMALPLIDLATGNACGALVLGLSPYRPLDDEYDGFLRLLGHQTARGLVDARAGERERERTRALDELTEAKSRFFSSVSHEFRTPLTLLQGPLAEALADDDHPLDATQRSRVEMAKRNADRMGKLVNALLDFSRLESGKIRASYRATDLTALTRELSSAFPSAIDQAGLDYHVDVQPLPDDVYVDREMWEKVVFNLISNAIKFTFDGSISVRQYHAGEHVELQVEDTGVGIPSEELPHLFERFHRVREARARSQEGTGIGLALVRELVDLHGGRIDVDTEVDRGTRFTVSVPYGLEHLPSDQIDAESTLETTAVAAETYVDEVADWSDEQVEEQGQQADPAETAGAHILIADDNADMRSYLRRLLGVHWRVETVKDGAAALEAARRKRPDLILTDVIMPRLDGFELLEQLRADPHLEDVPIILLSARASEDSRVEGLDSGADDYLVKPFTVAELIARVRSNLRLAQQRAHTADVRARQAMLAGLSHEMQTPLAAILGAVAIIEEAPLPEPMEPALDIMRRQATQLRGLVQQFLDFSRFESGREPVLQLTACDPEELVVRAVEVFGNERLRVEVDRELPHVVADPDRVEQILTNLSTNALKFTDEDCPVTVGARGGSGDRVVFFVRDQGAGIPADEASRVFGKFFRGRSSNGVEGTGLGLYVSRALAQAMGGSLTLRSEDEPGATFELALPASSQDHLGEPTPA